MIGNHFCKKFPKSKYYKEKYAVVQREDGSWSVIDHEEYCGVGKIKFCPFCGVDLNAIM